MTHRRIVCLLALAAVAVGTGGCATVFPSQPSPVDSPTMGLAVRSAVALQTLNPQAGMVADVRPTTFDAQTAALALTKWRNTFKEPPPTFNIIGIGGPGR